MNYWRSGNVFWKDFVRSWFSPPEDPFCSKTKWFLALWNKLFPKWLWTNSNFLPGGWFVHLLQGLGHTPRQPLRKPGSRHLQSNESIFDVPFVDHPHQSAKIKIMEIKRILDVVKKNFMLVTHCCTSSSFVWKFSSRKNLHRSEFLNPIWQKILIF